MPPGREPRPLPPPWIQRTLHFLRDGWLIVGVTLFLLLLLEGAYRAQHAIRNPARPSAHAMRADSSLHPYAGAAWFPEFMRAHASLRRVFDPYRSFHQLPTATRYLTIDSAGRRSIPQPAARPPVRRVFFIGGSTMWGATARDSFTIPALTARRLHELGVEDVEAVMLAQGSYNITQGMITLHLALAAGDVPSAVVFLDGYNDAVTGIIEGEPGHTYGDRNIQRQIELGRRTFAAEVLGFGRHSALIRRLQQALGRDPDGVPARPAPGDAICASIAGHFRGVARVVAETASGFGFPVLFFRQPDHASTNKPLTPWEAALRPPDLLRACGASIDSAMTPAPTGSVFVSLASLFDQDTQTVFVDNSSHVTEEANGRIADVMARELVQHLAATSRTPRG